MIGLRITKYSLG